MNKRIDIAQRLKRIENWMDSWRQENGSYNGVIVTFWENTLDTIQANSVHQAPIIKGYLNLYQKTGDRTFLSRAVRAADFLVQDLDDNNHYRQTASDVPGKPAGPIQDIECDLALLFLYKGYQNEIDHPNKYLDTVIRNTQGHLLQNWWNGYVLSHYVANQIAKSGEMLLELYQITGTQKYLNYATDAGDWLIDHQIKTGPLQGAMEQSFTDSRIIWVYQAPCLPCLVKLYRETKQNKYQTSANLLAQFIKKGELRDGGFIGLYEQRRFLKLINYLIQNTISLRPILLSFKKNLLNSFASSMLVARRQEPTFIARLAEILVNLLAWEPTMDLNKHLSFIFDHQIESGGIKNWLGQTPVGQNTKWTSVVPVMRWNTFVFELLSKLMNQDSDYSSTIDTIPLSRTIIPQFGLVVESQNDFAILEGHDGDYSPIGIYKKSSDVPALNLAASIHQQNLLVVTPIFPPETGGCSSRMSDFVQFLDEANWNVLVVTNQTSKSISPTESAQVRRIPLFVSFKQIHKLVATGWHLARLINKHKIDVVLTTIPPGLHAVLTIFMTKLMGRQIILDIRDPWIMGEVYTGTIDIDSWKYRIGRHLEKYMFDQANKITSVYQSVAQNIINQYPDFKDKIYWIPNGINSEFMAQADSIQEPSDPKLKNKTIFLYQGLMARPQDVGRIIDYIPQILKIIPNALFVLIGDGEEKTKLIHKVQNTSFKDRVVFKDKMSRPEVLQWIKRADYGIVPLGDKFSYAVPSKLFDYLIFRKPIVAIVPKGGETDQLLDQYELGVNLLSEPFHRLQPIDPKNRIFTDYNRKTNTQRLIDLLKSLPY